MSSTLKYALRYVPLLILALILIPLRVYTMGKDQHHPAFSQYQPSVPFSSGTALYSVTMLSTGEVWAVGGSFSKKSVPGQFPLPTSGMILHYVNHSWMAASVTAPLRLPLLSVSLDSPHDGWAVGWAGTFVHYDGNIWSVASGPANFNQNVLGVVMLSAADGWAAGYSGSILHYNGKQWIQVQSPTQLDLYSIAMLSAQEGWAVGDGGTILHYHEGRWSNVSPSPIHSNLKSVSMLSAQEGWAVGDGGTIVHYRDGTWERVYPVNDYQHPSIYQSVSLLGIAMNSIRSGWIIGDQHFLTYSSEAWIEPNTRIAFSGNGKVPELTSNALSLYSITLSPAGEGWAVGRADDYKLGSAFVILHYQGGVWNVSLIAV